MMPIPGFKGFQARQMVGIGGSSKGQACCRAAARSGRPAVGDTGCLLEIAVKATSEPR